MLSPKDSTLALTSPNDVHHSVSLSKHEIYCLYLHLILSLFFWKKNTQTSLDLFEYFKNVNSNLPPWFFRRWTGPPIHANQNNHTTTKKIVLVLCFVTVLCDIVNRSYMLNTVQHSYMIKVFLSINEEETKPCWNNEAQLCVTKLFTLFQFSPQKC